MKKTRKILAIILCVAMVLSVFAVTTFAVKKGNSNGNILDNDRFYAVIPEGYSYKSGYSTNYYYMNEDVATIEIFVLGNLMFPDGMNETEEETVKKRYTNFVSEEELSTITIDSAKKEKINGFTAWVLSGERDDMYEYETYILATRETLYMVVIEDGGSDGAKLMNSFIINGTYYEGDAPTVEHDFSKSISYIEAIERDLDNPSAEETMGGFLGIIGFGLILLLACPIIIIVLAVKLKKYKNKVKEYESYCGPIEAVRGMANAQYMQMMNNNMNAYNYGAYGNNYGSPINPAPVNPIPQMVQNDVSNEASLENNVDSSKSGNYPANDNQPSETTEN